MQTNSLTNNLIIYKIKQQNNQNKLLIIISLYLGWIILPLKINHNLFLGSLFFGYTRLYKFFFKLKGFGFKWKYIFTHKKVTHKVYFKLGFTHRLVLILKKNCICKLKKRRFVLKHRSYNYLRQNFNLLFLLYKLHVYNKKGIYLRGTKFLSKISKKKSKF